MRTHATLAGLLMLFFGAPALAGDAHPEAVLKSPHTSIAAGGSLELNGSDFQESEKYRLRLLGALREYDLREVQADSAGAFSIELSVPAEVAPGSYQIVAIASDGDIVARLDMTVLKAVAAASGAADASHEAISQVGSESARSDDIRIERNWSGLEWGVIGLLIGLAGGLGLVMIRGSRSTTPPSIT